MEWNVTTLIWQGVDLFHYVALYHLKYSDLTSYLLYCANLQVQACESGNKVFCIWTSFRVLGYPKAGQNKLL